MLAEADPPGHQYPGTTHINGCAAPPAHANPRGHVIHVPPAPVQPLDANVALYQPGAQVQFTGKLGPPAHTLPAVHATHPAGAGEPAGQYSPVAQLQAAASALPPVQYEPAAQSVQLPLVPEHPVEVGVVEANPTAHAHASFAVAPPVHAFPAPHAVHEAAVPAHVELLLPAGA